MTGRERVLARYGALAADLQAAVSRPPGDAELAAATGALLAAEARLLDGRDYARWLDLLADDVLVWVPLRPDAHPAADQSLFLDDRRRLAERVWRLADPNAWALQPPPWVTRVPGAVEAWPDGSDETLVAATLQVQHVRGGRVWSSAGRTVHRLRRTDRGWRIVHKILTLPVLTAGAPNLGWLL
ncbi:hypothetical protein BJF78_04255 [Pseudonocardia sp. CNS-139]|nr:hypothetical protein BJF78_04255 [Pseudonocardia sp. CNS-139]